VSLTIELSWPEPCLWPNRTGHWSVKAEAKDVQKNVAYVLTKEAMSAVSSAAYWEGYAEYLVIRLKVIGHKPNKRIRDRDNLQAALKSAFDGIAAAFGVDDSHFLPATDWGDNQPPDGGVTVVIG
jgi:hypothetical protein